VILDAFITQLRANAPAFNGRVAGAAEFVAGLKNYNTSLPLPAAYVVPLGQEADANLMFAGMLQQTVHRIIGVIVELDAQRDRRGQDPAMSLDDIQTQVFASVLNLVIDPCRQNRGAAFSGARELDLDRARLFYQFEFSIDWMITDLDGVQPSDQGIDLKAIELDIFKAPVTAGDEPAAVALIITGDPPIPPATDGPWPAEGDT
jgi:hypothetical protein